MKNVSVCQFCAGEVITVDGVLGPQLFCRTCRRFQATPEMTYAEPKAKNPRQTAQKRP